MVTLQQGGSSKTIPEEHELNASEDRIALALGNFCFVELERINSKGGPKKVNQ